tara:strand:- start:518 stop:1300 length:783 start_codon:yes stop_codon:yes gene_type:complete
VFNLFIVPNSQNLGRDYIKESNIDFLPKLISEKKFIDVAKNLTIFVEEYNFNGEFEKIYIKEVLGKNSSKIISANFGRVIKKNDNYFLRLNKGGITNIEKNNTYSVNFLTTEYDLSKFSTKTVTEKKIQETDSLSLLKCVNTIYFVEESKKSFNEICNKQSLKQISQEMFKRIIVPFYILIISLIGSSLVIKPKRNLFQKFHKLNIFTVGVIIILLSQVSLKLIGKNIQTDLFFCLLPITLVIFYYFFLFLRNKFTFKTL